MEAQSSTQVRRIHIIYFLSRKGKIEHPHLIRVHHLSRNGVRLRDVKRWLGELRGMEMPESFSWSYKRRYKAGYVWQDLVDNDLINPISDNEYVLKGSEISSTAITEEKLIKTKDEFLREDSKTTTRKEENSQSHTSSQTSTYISTKSSSKIEQESPSFRSESSTVTEDSIKADDKMEKTSSKSTKPKKDEKNPPADEKKDHSFHIYSTLLRKKNKKKTDKVEKIHHSDNSKITISEPQLSKSKSTSNGPSSVLRNLIACGPLDTNDSAVVAINKQNNHISSSNNNNRPNFFNMCSSDLRNVVRGSAEICKGDGQLGGSQRILKTPKWTQQQLLYCGRKSVDGVKDSLKSKRDYRDERAPSAAYLPVNVPDCSQCGKPFKPEKLHAHMKSCKGMKTISKTAAISADVNKAPKRPIESENFGSLLLVKC